jgi:CRP/FNR family cyclic AMP-dependent transcriptional regulator
MSGFQSVSYTDGQALFEPGDVAERFYVIQSGQVAIIDRQRNHQLALLPAGASFGEQSLLAGGVRSAAAQAVGPTTCMEITAQGLRDLLAKEGGIATPVLEALLLQLYMHNAMKS